jgi:hypothetical protein
MKTLLSASVLLLSTACTTVTTMDGREITNSAPQPDCQVTVYQTYQSAISKGPIEELCVVRGTSSFSLVHTVAVAIDKQKQDICACGARNAYIQASSATGWDVASVTLVAFRFSDPAKQPQSTRPKTAPQ